MKKEYIERKAALEVLEKSLKFSELELDIGEYRKGCIAATQDDISNITHIPAAEVVEVKKGEILLSLGIEELRHLINDAIFYIRMMEKRNRNTKEIGYFSRQDLLEKLQNAERYYEMICMPVCKANEEDTGGNE